MASEYRIKHVTYDMDTHFEDLFHLYKRVHFLWFSWWECRATTDSQAEARTWAEMRGIRIEVPYIEDGKRLDNGE